VLVLLATTFPLGIGLGLAASLRRKARHERAVESVAHPLPRLLIRFGERNRERTDLTRARTLENLCACVQRRACRSYIVNQHDDPSDEHPFACTMRQEWRQRERVPNVAPAPGGSQSSLWCCCLHAPERVDDRPVETSGEIRGLIEAARETTPCVKRYWHHAAGIRQQVGSSLVHQGAQPDRERSTSFVFESVDDLPKRTVVAASRSRSVDRRLRGARQRDEVLHFRPAGRADGAASGVLERCRAGGASWCKDDGQKCVGDVREAVHWLPLEPQAC
jgi:hypothetical protein